MDYLAMNQKAWDQRTTLHFESNFYDVDTFIRGKSSLNPIELEEVGDVAGKSLLHLQCHFGQDSLSWARKGAKVTGVDLSTKAIEKARYLAEEMGIDAEFINADVCQFGRENSKLFDIVFTSYGVLGWLPDLKLWATTISNSLKSGGQFNLIEFHPMIDLLSGYSYFAHQAPDIEEGSTYTENGVDHKSMTAQWSHPISEVITALREVGISIDSFHEHPYSPYCCFEDLIEVKGEGYQMLHKGKNVPLLYSIKGYKK
ncbi:class I SAM-dependent methyltransferase [Vibrio sp. E150_011]